MTNKDALIYVSIIVVMSVFVSWTYNNIDLDVNQYVSAQGGSRCYVVGHEPGNIKHRKYHDTMKNCKEYIEVVMD